MRGTLPRIDKYDKYVMPAECDVGESWPYQHYDQVRSMEEFKNSLEIGCPVCIWLFQDAQFDLTQESLELQHVELWPGMSCCNVYLRFSNYWGRCKIYSNKVIEPSLSTVLQTSPSSRRQIIAKAGRWLKKCQTHENCAKHKSKRLPTRLVSIDRAECGLSAKVVDSSILPSNTEYMTLSHAWGKIPFFTLCKSNLEKCMQSLPMEKLQPVFQDAVMITHDLGFSYIWIDSMCIVQDSEEDWVRESATMHHVYGNSSCNLAATGFADGRTGLLTQSFSDRVLSSKISVTSPIGAWIPRTFRLAQAHPWREQITRNHLSKRGWVLQEQLMAPRTIHFTLNDIYWECAKSTASGLFPDGFPPGLEQVEGSRDYDRSEDSIKKAYRFPLQMTSGLAKGIIHQEWNSLIERYSQTVLTRSQDKLPALSGLAQLYSDHLQDEYLAGLWRANLLTGIMWEHVSPEHGNVVAMDDRAPSWSWASIDGTIWYPDTSDGWQPECRILEASATPVVPGNVTGQVNGGHIVICDRLHEVILHPSTDGYLDAETLNTGQIHLHKGPGCEVLARLHGDPDLNDSSYLLPVFERPENDIQNFCMSRGLVLRRDATSGHYRRIGIFKTWSRSAKKTFSQSVWHLPPDRYEDFDGNDRYTIRIV